MADSSLDILVRTKADLGGVQDASRSLKEMGTAGVEANRGIAEETEKLTVKKTDLKSAVKGLTKEFPELGHIARLALNPIAFVVAGIAAAFKIWSYRIAEIQSALGNMELPDAIKSGPGHISANTEAWADYNEKLRKGVEANGAIDKAAARGIEAIKEELKLQKELLEAFKAQAEAKIKAMAASGEISGNEASRRLMKLETDFGKTGSKMDLDARQKELNAETERLFALSKDAAKKEKEAAHIKIGSAEDDKATLERYKQNADKAKEDLAKMGEGPSVLRMLWRGLLGVPAAQQISDFGNAQDAARSTVRAYENFQTRLPTRERLRQRRDELYSESAAEQTEVGAGVDDVKAGQRSLNRQRAVAGQLQSSGELTQAYRLLEAERKKYDLIFHGLMANHSLTASQAQEMQASTAMIEELNRRVRSLEGSRKAWRSGL